MDEKSNALPKWMMTRYAKLWQSIKSNEFTIEETIDILKEDRKTILVLLSNLRKQGWLNVSFDKEDARKRKYSLINPEQVVGVMIR